MTQPLRVQFARYLLSLTASGCAAGTDAASGGFASSEDAAAILADDATAAGVNGGGLVSDAATVEAAPDGGPEVPDAAADGGPDDVSPAPLDASSDGAPPGPPGLVYWFPFDGSGADRSGYGLDGTFHDVGFVADRFGTPDRAARFDGTTSWMSASGVRLPLGALERTVAAWVCPGTSPAPGLYGGAFISWGSSDCVGQMFGLGDEGDALNVWTGCDDVQTQASLPRSAWTFVAVRFTPPRAVRVWTGNQATDVSLPLAPSTSASLLWVGAETVSDTSASIRQHFAGSLDSLRIYARALADDEVLAVSQLP